MILEGQYFSHDGGLTRPSSMITVGEIANEIKYLIFIILHEIVKGISVGVDNDLLSDVEGSKLCYCTWATRDLPNLPLGL